MRQSLVNSNFNRTYNPCGKQNALSDIKRLLTSRDTVTQEKGFGFLIEALTRYKKQSNERIRLVEYLLDNDVTVFLCEATSNLDLNLFRLFVACVRQLWCARMFAEQHAAQCAAAALRALQQHADPTDAIQFLYELLNGVSEYKAEAPLSPHSAFSTDQLLACFSSLAPRINTNSKTILSSSLVLQALVTYQPENLDLRSQTVASLVEVLKVWFNMLVGSLNHLSLVDDKEMGGVCFVVTCQLGLDVMRLAKLLNCGKQNPSFVQAILADEQEMTSLKDCAVELKSSIHHVLLELVGFTKDNQNQISSDEYEVFLKFLLNFFHNCATSDQLSEFCDVLLSKGYLTMLPQSQIVRTDASIRKISTLVLGEMLKGLAHKYLDTDSVPGRNACARDIHMGLVELQCGIEQPHNIGSQLQKSQPYSLLVYIYFYCQSSENPEEATAPLLPYLAEHILRMPKSFRPPPYIIKALWLVFAMSTISSSTLTSLNERVYLEKATDRLITLLQPEPSVYYTHNPALLLWAFVSQRIPNQLQLQVLSQWFKTEDVLPSELTNEPEVWDLLLSILAQSKDPEVLQNCIKSLYGCLEEIEDDHMKDFGLVIWSMLPGVLSKALIEFDSSFEINIRYLLDLSFELMPRELDQTLCFKLAVLITSVFARNSDNEAKYEFEFACLKLSMYLLGLANNQNDNRVLLTFTSRPSFLLRVLSTTNSPDIKVACTALRLLSYIVFYFTKYNYQPKSVLQIHTNLMITSLRSESSTERGESFLQLLYMILSSGPNTPLVLNCSLEASGEQLYGALRALLLRIQMLCCREAKSQSVAGWKTFGAIFRYAIFNKNDAKLVATLTSQPWTHTLIHFQITQNITDEFLKFTHTWLKLMKFTLNNTSKEKKMNKLSKQGLVIKTLTVIKKNLNAEDGIEVKQKILVLIKEFLEEFGTIDV